MDKYNKFAWVDALPYKLNAEVAREVCFALDLDLSKEEDVETYNKAMSGRLCDLEDTINIYELSFMKEDTTPIDYKENKKMNIKELVKAKLEKKIEEKIEELDLEEMIENAAIITVFIITPYFPARVDFLSEK